MFASIISSIVSNYSIDELQIACISQLSTSKHWQIQFKDDNSFSAALGKEIDIDGDSHTLTDANSTEYKAKESDPVTLTVFIRVHWLPYGFKDKAVNFIRTEAPFLTVVDASTEKWEKGKSTIENGIINVKVSYKIEDNQKFRFC